jgi:hypothetical protein
MDVARHPGLMRRKARWYLRAKIPVDLISFLGRHEVWRSLRTGDHALAVKRYHRARADLDAWFEQQRRRRDVGERINGEVPKLVLDWFRAAEHQASHDDFELTGELLHEALGETEQHLYPSSEPQWRPDLLVGLRECPTQQLPSHQYINDLFRYPKLIDRKGP